ncbi:MAG: helix-turn-helix domain-containing protein [Lachnospiraceae bacterium]|nr:helix-turn-helix domain-containing protein [Lachnospiraceae bacterium]
MGGFTETKIAKMLELIPAMKTEQNMSQDMLAKKIEVGKRTVARYLNELSDIGIVEHVGAVKGEKYLLKKH